MSKKNKVSSAKKDNKKDAKASKPANKNKATKVKIKTVAKNTAKKVAKPVAKKNSKPLKAIKKTAPKVAKKTVTKVKASKGLANKATKVAAKKITAKPIKKVIKTSTGSASKISAKVVAKKITAKKVKKTKTVVSKPLPKKEVAPVIEKKVEVTIPKKITKNVKANNDVIALNNTIPVKKENEISLSKIASISSAITNPIKKTESYSIKPEKEPNGKFEIEFVIKASADLLYEFLYTQSGLSEWFCDDVNIRNGIYTFIWDGQMQQARLLKTVDNQLVRYQWVDKTDGSFFEFRLQHDDLTNDVSLMITDFAESGADKESSKLLWQNQVEKLMHVVGSI